MSFVSWLLPLALVVACSALSGPVTYTFNASLVRDCLDAATPCSFLNPSLWVPEGVPNENDTIIILNAPTNLPLQFAITSPVSFDTLNVSNIVVAATANTNIGEVDLSNSTITFSNNSTQSIVALYVSQRSVATVKDWSQLQLHFPSFLILDASSSLNVLDHATFKPSSADLLGAIEFQADTTIHFGDATYSPSSAIVAAPLTAASLWVPNNTVATFTTPVTANIGVGANSTFQLTGAPFEGSVAVNFNSSVAVFSNCPSVDLNAFPEPISGVGVVRVLTSPLNVSPNDPIFTFEGTLVLGGLVRANLTGVPVFNINCTTGHNNEEPNVTLIANGLKISKFANITGRVLVEGQGLTLAGALVVNGHLGVINSSVTLGGSVRGGLDAWLKTDGTLYANFELPPNSSLAVSTKMGSVFGTLINNGVVDVASDRTLQIWDGDYIQGNTSLHVLLNNETTPCLDVLNGSIIFSNQSTLAFNVQQVRHSNFLTAASFVVARASVAINGSFAGDAAPLAASNVTRTLAVNVDHGAKTITIQYDFSAAPIPSWVIPAAAGGGVALIVAVVGAFVFIKGRKKRSAYAKIAQ